MAYIYKLTDKRNGSIYIGQHNGSIKNYFTSGNIPLNIIEIDPANYKRWHGDKCKKKYGENIK